MNFLALFLEFCPCIAAVVNVVVVPDENAFGAQWKGKIEEKAKSVSSGTEVVICGLAKNKDLAFRNCWSKRFFSQIFLYIF